MAWIKKKLACTLSNWGRLENQERRTHLSVHTSGTPTVFVNSREHVMGQSNRKGDTTESIPERHLHMKWWTQIDHHFKVIKCGIDTDAWIHTKKNGLLKVSLDANWCHQIHGQYSELHYPRDSWATWKITTITIAVVILILANHLLSAKITIFAFKRYEKSVYSIACWASSLFVQLNRPCIVLLNRTHHRHKNSIPGQTFELTHEVFRLKSTHSDNWLSQISILQLESTPKSQTAWTVLHMDS